MQSLIEALEINQKLNKINQNANLPEIAGTMHNIANLLRALNRFEKAIKFYNKTAEIRLKLTENNPNVFEVSLADTYLCLSNLYRSDIINKELSTSFALKCINLYQKYWDINEHAKNWGNIARENLRYWESHK